jgi:hypothetical protein
LQVKMSKWLNAPLGLAMLLSSVLRTWLDGADPDLASIMPTLDRAGAWAAPHGLPDRAIRLRSRRRRQPDESSSVHAG